ncbi:hypothetical protein B0J12DRAFT_759457 [Macrophomina phaseolina]|uniref:Uncharacterized protein n=1 Tax=Macrophomina phaseolina TaxID=35725 RepID=A0ABQ8GU28_9PEZI|nr:hypothetical protein B0J12DRAFT_759457 [Macrophomina phaseolina]
MEVKAFGQSLAANFTTVNCAMADALPSYKVLRDSSPSEVVSIFRNALFSAPHEAFSQHLLSGVVQGSILPHTFEIWIGVSKSPVPIQIALTQQGSLKVRRAAIRQFGKCLKSEEWRETWDGLGGVPGLLDLLSGLSVLEVKEFCGTVLCSVKGSGKAEKRQAIFQLLRSLLTGPLLPTEGTTAPHRDPDERPLTKYYERLVRKCPLEVVEDIYLRNLDETSGESKFDLLSTGYMVRNHRDFMERLAIQSIFEPRSGRTPPTNAPGLRELLQGGSSGSRAEPKFSTSMRFALDLLKRLASAEYANFPDELFSEGLVEPLLRKCRKKNVQWERILEIVKLTAEYLSRSPKAVAALQEKKRGYSSYRYRPAKKCLLSWTAELWTAHPAEFEQPLQLLIKLSHKKGSGVDSFMFDGISEKARYGLLRLCFISVGWGDLDNDTSQISPDPEKFMLSLLQRRSNNMEALQLCVEEFEKHKKKAMSSREQSDRASHARQALDWAIASKSLGVYKDAVLWARRFIRDALTIPELHQRNSYEARYLLTGDPGNLESDKHTVTSLRDQVVEANEILWIHLETFLMALREPAFNVTFWTSTFALFQNVIDLRQRVYSQALKETKRFSEEDIYKILWEDTLPLLVKAEKVVLQPGHERLGRNNTGGILGLHSCIQVTDGQASTYQFFDELAKARDQLWQEYRPTILPAVAALPDPYPRGLPIEHLTSCFRMRSSQPEKLTPYIASRARAVLFMDPVRAKTSFPEDEEMRTAIGEFVDSYQEALEIYIPKALPQAEKRKRVEEVWSHAIGPLSGDRMTLAEAYRYWRKKGSGNERVEFWPDASTEAPGQPEPLQYDFRVPKVEDPREIVEWNPIPPPVTPIKERKLSLTYIDVAKAMSCDNSLRVRSPWKDIHPTVPGVPAHQLCRMVKMSRTEDMEFDVVLALLLLDAKNGAKRRILTTPFPSEEDIHRYT